MIKNLKSKLKNKNCHVPKTETEERERKKEMGAGAGGGRDGEETLKSTSPEEKVETRVSVGVSEGPRGVGSLYPLILFSLPTSFLYIPISTPVRSYT